MYDDSMLMKLNWTKTYFSYMKVKLNLSVIGLLTVKYKERNLYTDLKIQNIMF